MTIGVRIKQLRENQGKTIKQVAEAIGVSASTYRDWELGTKISGEPYVKMANTFGISLSFLMTGHDPSKNDLMEDLKQVKSLLERMERNINLAR